MYILHKMGDFPLPWLVYRRVMTKDELIVFFGHSCWKGMVGQVHILFLNRKAPKGLGSLKMTTFMLSRFTVFATLSLGFSGTIRLQKRTKNHYRNIPANHGPINHLLLQSSLNTSPPSCHFLKNVFPLTNKVDPLPSL